LIENKKIYFLFLFYRVRVSPFSDDKCSVPVCFQRAAGYSGKHKIVAQMSDGFWFWYKKTAMSKKKIFAARNLKICQIYHSKQEKEKRKSNIFYRYNFVLS